MFRHRPVRVYTVDHLYLVSAAGEFVRQPLDKYSIPAEVVWRVEGRDHAEAERSSHYFGLSRIGYYGGATNPNPTIFLLSQAAILSFCSILSINSRAG
jgi:hypothetical protein